MKQIFRILLAACIVLSVLSGASVFAQAAGKSEPKQTVSPSVAAAIATIENFIAEKETQLSLRINEQRRSVEMERASFEDLAKRSNKLSESSLSIESFPEIVKTLQTQRIELMIREAGIEGRMKAVLASQKAKKQRSVDGIAIRLEQILEIQKSALATDRKRFEQGIVSRKQLQDTEKATLETELRLEQVKQGSDVGSEGLGSEFTRLSLSKAETQAQLAKIDELLGTVSKQRDNVEEVRKISRELEYRLADSMRQKQATRDLEMEIEALRMRIAKLKNGAEF